MKKVISFRSIIIALLIALTPLTTVLAHGGASITVRPFSLAPGDEIVITGVDMEEGEVFSITLEGATGVTLLGEATAVQVGDEAGFTATFTIPIDVAPGSYLVRAATEEGEAVTADLTIKTSVNEASEDAIPMEASAAPLALDRSKSAAEIILVSLVVLLSLVGGIWVIRKPE